jgi:hypothetical protein
VNTSFMKIFEQNHEKIYQDYLAVKDSVISWPERDLYRNEITGKGQGWDVYGIFVDAGVSNIDPNTTFATNESECSFTRSLITEYIPSHGTAGFSILRPGTDIAVHVGVQSNNLRMHLGLDVPEGDLGLFSDTHGLLRWETGKAFYFDDRKRHAAWNKSDKDRVVLIVDFKEE